MYKKKNHKHKVVIKRNNRLIYECGGCSVRRTITEYTLISGNSFSEEALEWGYHLNHYKLKCKNHDDFYFGLECGKPYGTIEYYAICKICGKHTSAHGSRNGAAKRFYQLFGLKSK